MQFTVLIVIAEQRAIHTEPHYGDTGGSNADGGGMAVSTHQSAAAQQNTAEITGDNDRAVGKIIFLNDIEYRHSRCAGRFTVIGIAGNAAVPQPIGVDVVGGVGKAAAERLKEAAETYIPDEARPFFREFILPGGCGRFVFLQRFTTLRLKLDVLFCCVTPFTAGQLAEDVLIGSGFTHRK